MNRLVFTLFILMLLSSCKKDRPEEGTGLTVVDGGRGLIVGSEGNFQFGNASISLYDYESQSVSVEVFKNANEYLLGDVLQSMYQMNNSLYLVVNNSSKIEVVDRSTFKSIGSISGLASPRYFLPVSNSKAYVSDLYSNSISVLDLNSQEVKGSINVSGWTEEMILLYGKAFVCNKGKNLLYVIDTSTDEILDSIVIGSSPSNVQQDQNGMLWVLCQGDNDEGAPAGLYKVNPISFEVEIIFDFNVGDQVGNLDFNGANDTLYYLCSGSKNGVFRMSIADAVLPSSSFISSAQGGNYYGLAVDPYGGEVLVSDAIDYVQKSKVSVYDPKGNLLTSFTSGINTSSFMFTR